MTVERAFIVVMHPREQLRDVLCDRTCELVPHLEHIASAEPILRRNEGGRIISVQAWRARANVSGVLRHHIDRGLLEWICRIERGAEDFDSRWTIEPRALRESPLCVGALDLAPAAGGRGTRIALELEIVAMQPSAGWRTLTQAILTTHFRKLIDAACRVAGESPSDA
jgi:hypothetical protein